MSASLFLSCPGCSLLKSVVKFVISNFTPYLNSANIKSIPTLPSFYSRSEYVVLFFFKFYLCIYLWLRWVFVAACRLSLVAARGGYSLLQCTGFSLQRLLLLRSTGSRGTGFSSCGLRALEHRLSSCGARASLLCGMRNLPRPGLEPVSPALTGGFLTTAPPEKPRICGSWTRYCSKY